jgi:hypothetical protein
MSLRRRPIARRVLKVTGEVRAAARDLDAWEAYWGGPTEARDAWEKLSSRLVRRGAHRPAPWWAYEPGIPAELRRAPSPPDPRGVLRDPPQLDGEAMYVWRSHQLARLEWLIRSGQLDARELQDAAAHAVATRKAIKGLNRGEVGR